MNFQQQVRTVMREQAEIDAERQGRIVVYPTAAQTSTECFPCLAIEVFRAGQMPKKTWVDLRELGQHFSTLDAAMEAARSVQVLSVGEDGEVQWEIKS